MKKSIIILISFVFLFSSAVFAKEPSEGKKKYTKSKDGLKTLMKIGRDRKKMSRELEKETANFQKVAEAISHNQLNKGETAAHIKRKYGKPSLIMLDEKNGGEKWVYKPQQVSFFSKEKVYLIFDKDARLIEWYAG